MSQNKQRAEAHRALDMLMDQFELITTSDDARVRLIAGRLLLAEAAAFAGSICGEQLMAELHGSVAAHAEKKEKLCILSGRLSIAAHLFRSVKTDDGACVANAAEEAKAISMGDEPQLFAQLNLNKKRSARVGLAKLRALEWECFLKAVGIPAADRHRHIAAEFGAEWETVRRKWRLDVERILTQAVVEVALNDARQAGLPAGRDKYLHWLFSIEEWPEKLREDGKAFLLSKGFER